MRLNTARKYWARMRSAGLPALLALPNKPYDRLTKEERDKVYDYWSGGEEWKKHHPK